MIYENLLQIQEKEPELLEYDTRKMYSLSLSKIVLLFPSVHTEQNNNEEIEEKANEYFQQLYREEKEVDDLVKTMKDFRSSSNRTEREIYACMVQNLFDEWKFFPKYPKKELSMTARLFGKIISEKKIIDGVVTDIGLKCIVEGLKREGKMFDFAITALEECKESIEHETGLKNILTCKQLQEKKPELYDYIAKRYKELHGAEEQQQQPPPQRVETKAPGIENFRPPIIGGPDPTMPKEISPNPMSNLPDPRMVEGSFHPGMNRQPKPVVKPNPLANTPTQPGKYFTEQAQNPGWKHTPNQKTGARMIYPNTTGPQRSARPVVENFTLGPPAEGNISNIAPRALNLQSKDFKPKTQQVQEYLKKEDLTNPPGEFMDNLITTLNMTGTDQIRKNAERLEEEIKEEYVPAIAHYMVVRRVIESDEKRIDFFANFFHCMRNRVIVKALRDECIEVILRIIINESVDPNNKNEVTRQASTPIKNVACFLGYLTLVHNQPLLSTDFNLKQLLLEGHEKKCMSIVIMVVCKILRTGEKSRVFTPYNPWMIGLYSMLLEYMNYYVDNSADFDKNIPKEIQLVLRNRRGEITQSRESTLFRDFDMKNANNKELIFLNNRMLNDPLINIPKIRVPMSNSPQAQEDGKEESSTANLYDNTFNQDMVIITESSQKFPQIDRNYLKILTNQGINQAMREIIEAVIRRVIPIASITTRTLVLKDFALEPDAERLRQASICTAKSLAGMLAQITCKDILRYQFIKSLKDLVYQSKEKTMVSLTEDQKRDLIETITKENSEIGCNKIIAAVQMEALNNISKDDSISTAIAKRIKYQTDGTDFRDLSNIDNFNRLPPILKPLDTGLTDDEFQVYQDFESIASIEQQIEEDTIRLLDDDLLPPEPEESKIQYAHNAHDQKAIIERFLGLCTSFVANEEKVIDFASTFGKELSELRVIMEKNKNSHDMLTEFFLTQAAPIALNATLLVNMIETQILSVSAWQKRFAFHLRQSLESIDDTETMEFLEQFIIRGVLDKGIIKDTHISDLIACIEMFSKTKKNDNANRWKLMLALFDTSDPSSGVFEDLASLYFKTWVNTRNHEAIKHRFSYKIGVVFKLSQHMEMFIKNALNEALEAANRNSENYSMNIIDLFSIMVISSSFNWISQPGERLINVIDESQVLEIIYEVMEKWHDERLIEFDQAPFKRILTRFLIHFSEKFKDSEFGDMEKLQKKSEMLIMFSNLFKKLTPRRFPAFAFAWLELISSLHFMPKLLSTASDYNTTERLFKCQELFVELFAFLKENIYENSPTSPALEKFFEGTLKLILVVLHDYPEFLSHNYFQFINHLPLYRTGNLRNMILAAYPRSMRLPDPQGEIVKFEPSMEPYGLYIPNRETLLQHYTDEAVFLDLKECLDKFIQTGDKETLKDICEILED